MNAYAVFILCALLLDFGVQVVADLLNLRALREELPSEFEGVYDAETYSRSQEYTRARTRFGLWVSGFNLAVLLAFWWLGGFGAIDEGLRSLEWGPGLTGLAFVGALAFGHMLLNLPFALHSTFRIEARFGFNKTDLATFWSDRLKGVLLAAVLGAPLLLAVFWFFRSTGDMAWIYAWVAATGFIIALQLVVPTWIMPLFNKFTPLEGGELRSSILDYARSVAFPLEGIFVIDGSKRSTKANAFFTGFGPNKRVALFDTLIEKHERPELVAIVAHEIGHYKKKHILLNMALSIAHTGALLALLGFFLSQGELFAAFGVQTASVHAGLVFFGLLFTPIELVLGVFLLGLSRRNEFEADRFAVETTGDGEAMAAALKHLSAENLSNLRPHPLHVVLNHSHPPVIERIAAIRRRTAELGAAG